MRVVSTKERFIKCYKLKKNFYIWEDTYEDGSTNHSSCCYSTAHTNEARPLCNGINEWGYPCVFAYPHCRKDPSG